MKIIEWNEEKNYYLKNLRNVCFEEVKEAIENKKILNLVDHPNQNGYPNQKIYILEIHNYAYLVPFVQDKEKIFLKTMIPSRKMTKKYLYKGG